MYLQHIHLENFRNHQQLELDFHADQRINYLIGQNALGKTNLLESVYLLALTKSFRGQKSAELINWQSEYARVKADFGYDESEKMETAGQLRLEIFLGKPPHPLKVLKKNEVKTGTENFLGNLKVVFFHPEDLNVLYLGPDLRRRYLDVLIIQEKPSYYRALQSYKKTLEQRNALLRSIREGSASADALDVWDGQLADFGNILIRDRLEAVSFLKEKLQPAYHQISQGNEKIEISYKMSWAGADRPLSGQLSPDRGLLNETDFLAALAANRRRDIEAGVTTIGPHRDDLVISLNERPLHEHASRGEYRSIILALKILEMDYHHRISGIRPLVLLDDVFSELDDPRRSMLVSAIQDHQVLITSTKIGEHFIERTHRSLKEYAATPNIIKIGAQPALT